MFSGTSYQSTEAGLTDYTAAIVAPEPISLDEMRDTRERSRILHAVFFSGTVCA